MRRLLAAAALALVSVGCEGGASPDDNGGVPGEKTDVTAEASGADAATAAIERGAALQKEGKADEAAAVYKEALGRSDVPEKLRADLFLRMSHLLAHEGQWDRALDYARGAQKLRPDWDDAAMTV